ncbi:GlxA family transcriptional regulator [Streptomyces celluloflavus]|uniref:GlxA family transcriptional regulator n=1 Tax=Streptomyces celluloflavus TaxID=58344 RepID=UPI00367D5226
MTYEVRLCAPGGAVGTAAPAPLGVVTPYGLEGLAAADVILIPAHGGHRAEPPPTVRAALRAAADRGCRVASVGTDVFTLAAAGLLDGRHATTSWRHMKELAARHPRVSVDPLGTVARDGSFLTTAGVFGGMDVCLHLLAGDRGRRVAGQTSRELIAPLHPYADDVQDTIARELTRSAGLEPTLAWMRFRLHTPLTLTDLAAHARTSPSSLSRRFRAHTGLSPRQYLLRTHLQEAQRLLEETGVPVERLAAETGFASPASLRSHFRALTGTTPRDYRRSRRGGEGAACAPSASGRSRRSAPLKAPSGWWHLPDRPADGTRRG